MRAACEIEVHVEAIADGVILRPMGSIDYGNAPVLWRHLEDLQRGAPDRLIIDLAEVPSIDSSVIATLVESMRVARRTSRMLVLCGLQDPVRALFEIVRLDDSVFTIVENVRDAMEQPNRRKFGRFRLHHLKCDRGRVLDISAGGMRLRTAGRLRRRVALRLWDDEVELQVTATVAWSQRIRFRRHEVGLRFVALDEIASKQLAAILNRAAERTARARRRTEAGGAGPADGITVAQCMASARHEAG